MVITWGLLIIQFTLPLLIFFSQPLPIFQPQEVLGLFGSEFKDLYNECAKRTEQQSRKITNLTGALKETETKLKDVDVYQESLEQKEEVLKSRKEDLKNHVVAIDRREQLLEQRNFDFTEKLEEIAREGGKAQQIIANNEKLIIRVDDLERKLDEERASSREDLARERQFFNKRLEDERSLNGKLQDRIDDANRFVLIFIAIMGAILLIVTASIMFLFISWRKGKIYPPPQIPTIDAKRVEPKQDAEVLPPS